MMHDDKQPLLPFTTAHQYSDDENDSEDSVNSNPHTSISLQRITRDEMKHPAQHSSINSTDIKNSDNGSVQFDYYNMEQSLIVSRFQYIENDAWRYRLRWAYVDHFIERQWQSLFLREGALAPHPDEKRAVCRSAPL